MIISVRTFDMKKMTNKAVLDRRAIRRMIREAMHNKLKGAGDHSQRGELSEPGAGDSELADPKLDYMNEDSGEEEGEHYDLNAMSDEDHIDAIRRHLDHLEKDKEYDEDHVEDLKESRLRALRILRQLV